ncbi:MAG: ester cyclase [Chloroflexi bacterium]|nr:ester cyclase [Chloroflexota bacterium]
MFKIKTPLLFIGIMFAAIFIAACGDSESSKADATREENLEVVSRFIEEFKNNANHGIVDELMSPDFVHHLTDPRLPAGREGIKVLGQVIVAGFPDVHASVQELLADGDKVIERTQTSATHTGEFNGIPPTGKQVGWTEIHIYRLVDGKIAEQWSEIDLLGLLVQLGAIPGP